MDDITHKENIMPPAGAVPLSPAKASSGAAAGRALDMACNQLAYDSEVQRLQAELQDAYRMMQDKDHDLQTSAGYGQKLVDQNRDLASKLDSMQTEHATAMEELEQQKHDLFLRLEQQNTQQRITEHLEAENTATKEELDTCKERLATLQKAAAKGSRHTEALAEQLKAEATKAALVQEQHLAKIEQLEARCSELGGRRTVVSEDDDALAALQTQVNELSGHKERLSKQCIDLADAKAKLELDSLGLQHELDALMKASSIMEEDLFSTKDSLREAKLNLAEQDEQLQAFILASSQQGRGTGTSLFSEVEDKRIALEKKVKKYEVQYKALSKAHEMVKHQRHQLQTQCQMLLQMRGSKADVAKMQRLEQALSQAKSELLHLGNKVITLEREKTLRLKKLQEHHNAFTEFGSSQNYVDLLEHELKESKREGQELKEQLRTKTLQQMSEENKLRACQSELHRCERSVEEMTNGNMQLRMKIEEMRIQATIDKKYSEAAAAAGEEGGHNDGEAPAHADAPPVSSGSAEAAAPPTPPADSGAESDDAVAEASPSPRSEAGPAAAPASGGRRQRPGRRQAQRKVVHVPAKPNECNQQ